MSKELVVSATRHETRVAVLEDDQIVEIYHQREKEYSLAGSIHKGRVTRVLPGMQSAFVDIGLERDAFLYVSDFFEDNEEYDKVVSNVEAKVLRFEKGAQVPAAPGASAPVEPAPAPSVSEPAAPRAEAPAAVQPRSGQPGRDEDRDRGPSGRDRRSRRRGRGGIPESKYFSPSRPERSRPPGQEPPAEPEEQPSSGVVLLPGESLAKYSGRRQPLVVDTEFATGPTATGVEEGVTTESEIADAAQEAAEAAAEAAAETARDATAEAAAAEAAANAGAGELQPRYELRPRRPLGPAAAPQFTSPEPVAEVALRPEVEPVADTAPAFGAPELQTTMEEHTGEAGAEGASASSEDQVQPEGPEPARIPTSLTATLRDQGPRYLHRVSRRLRRRGREGQEARPSREPRADEPRAGEPAPAEPRSHESRPAEQDESRANGRIDPSSGPAAARTARAERPAATSIAELLREGQEILVQIAKEPLGQKGARITSHIALPGRFLVYMPTVEHVGVSRKIASDEERMRLKRILQTHRTGISGGYIVRTAGEGRSEEEIRADMLFLYNLWLDLRQKAETKAAPALVHHDLGVVERVLRDQLTADFKSIWVDNEEVYEGVLRFVQRFHPGLVTRVKLYTRPTPIFEQFNVTSELEKALRPKVWLKSGGYIVINQTEALVAIDVNTGKFVGRSNRLEDTIVKTNTDAIREIVRQIRLRDLGGIIVVDFIDMEERKNRQKVMQALEDAMRNDRAPYKILSFNDFGLVAITRKRVKQSLERTVCSPCPYCEGAGYIKSVPTVIGEILQEAQKLAPALEAGDAMLRVNPEVARFLKSSLNDYLQELEEILGRNVIVKSDPLLHQEKFDLA